MKKSEPKSNNNNSKKNKNPTGGLTNLYDQITDNAYPLSKWLPSFRCLRVCEGASASVSACVLVCVKAFALAAFIYISVKLNSWQPF